jgi:hypothetical protein
VAYLNLPELSGAAYVAMMQEIKKGCNVELYETVLKNGDPTVEGAGSISMF